MCITGLAAVGETQEEEAVMGGVQDHLADRPEEAFLVLLVDRRLEEVVLVHRVDHLEADLVLLVDRPEVGVLETMVEIMEETTMVVVEITVGPTTVATATTLEVMETATTETMEGIEIPTAKVMRETTATAMATKMEAM
jgi:hypothetical protein